MEEKIECLLTELAVKTQLNQQEEAGAVKGYTEQGAIIDRIRSLYPEYADKCDEWEKINEELIADELNHQQELIGMFADISGILPKND